MRITLLPVRTDGPMTLSRTGDVLTLDGERLDLSGLPDGAALPRDAVSGCPRLASDVTREDGVLRLSLILPHGARAPRETLFPEVLELTGDGPVALPPYDRNDEEAGQ